MPLISGYGAGSQDHVPAGFPGEVHQREIGGFSRRGAGSRSQRGDGQEQDGGWKCGRRAASKQGGAHGERS